MSDAGSGYRSADRGPARWYFEIPKRLYWGQLTGSDASLYAGVTAPTSGPAPKVKVTTIVVANTDTSARTVTLQIRTGASAAATHILSAVSFPANSTTVLTVDILMEAGELISGLADTTAKVNVRISGVELLTVPTA